MCFVMVVFVFVLFFFLVRDPFILAHAIGALLYLCIHWSVQSTLRKNRVHHVPFPVRDVVMVPGLLPIFLHGCEIKSGSGLGTRL